MNKRQQDKVNTMIKSIDKEIIGDRSFSDEQMIEALEEISSMCDSAVDAKREEMGKDQ